MSSAAKVGLFMLVILVIAGFLILRIEDLTFGGSDQTKTVDVLFDSVAGLDEKSAVRVAGVRVGKVERIRLTPEGHALVTLQIDDDVVLRQGATARVADLGLLGEKFVELNPGPPDAPVLGATEEEIVLRGQTGASIDQVTQQVSAIAEDVKAVTESMRNVMGGPAGEQRLDEIVENVREITARVRDLIAANEANVHATADNLRAITADLRVEIPKIAATIDRVANSLGGTVGENREDLRVIVENLRELSAGLRETNANLQDITGQVRSGEGTVGRLIYSDEAHTRLTSALESVEGGVAELSSTLGRLGKLELDLGIRADYYAGLDPDERPGFEGTSRTAVLADIRPDPEKNRFYRVELADVPRGRKEETVLETTVIAPDGTRTTIITEEVRFDRDFLISAQAGWRLDDDLAVRIGLIESSGGIGADYALTDRFQVTGEAFDFGKRRDDQPQLRLFGQYILSRERSTLPQIFLSSGVDNILNDVAFTIGGGIRWSDEDLKYLLGSIPIN